MSPFSLAPASFRHQSVAMSAPGGGMPDMGGMDF